jgi:hypothetical protein
MKEYLKERNKKSVGGEPGGGRVEWTMMTTGISRVTPPRTLIAVYYYRMVSWLNKNNQLKRLA